jgi:cytochrome c oxidase cbb3-type subunit III
VSATDPNSKIIATYDDIQEEDNHLPNWWLAILFGTIVFAFGYWIVYQTTKTMPNPGAEYAADVAKLKQERAERMAANPTSDEALMALVADPAAVEEGHKIFMTICAACHGPLANGLVGPNLTDKYWLHGNRPSELAKSVEGGYPEKGMPPQGMALGPEKVRQVVAYVLTLRNKNVPGKEPQGIPYD